jgi:hypothetical protein
MIRYNGFLFVALIGILFLSACKQEETYAKQKEQEYQDINDFIADNGIQVITMDQFLRDTITNNPFSGPDSTKNEYVLFSDKGVYLQIIQRGTGKLMSDGDRKFMTARYYEYDIANSDTLTMNLYNTSPESFYCSRTSDTYTASFISGIMFSSYGSAVPNGWIMTFPYIKPSFNGEFSAAKVRLIVSHNQGTQSAALSVNPRFYEITIKTEKWQ